MLNKQVNKANKSSIVQVIISNFDQDGVKEIRVVYRKNSGLDTIQVQKIRPDQLDFKTRLNKRGVEEEYAKFPLLVLGLDPGVGQAGLEDGKTKLVTRNHENGDLEVSQLREGKKLKNYLLSGEYITTRTGGIKVEISLRDRLFYNIENRKIGKKNSFKLKLTGLSYGNYKLLLDRLLGEKKLRRPGRASSMTNRLLLDSRDVDYYSYLAGPDLEIDSREISRINRFSDYRSNMELYLGLMKKLLGQNLERFRPTKNPKGLDQLDMDQDQAWVNKIFKDPSSSLNIRAFADRQNKMIDYKLKNLDPKASNYQEELKDLRDKYIDLDSLDFSQDLRKLIKLIKILSQALEEYDYKFFRDLHQGKDLSWQGESLSDLLDLEIFRQAGKVDLVKFNIRTNYLDEGTRVYVLGESLKAKKLLSRYINLGERIPGFTSFVNYNVDKYLGDKGLALEDYSKYFFRTIGILENSRRPNKHIIKEYKDLDYFFSRPFVQDIHSSSYYKNLYNKRKKLLGEKDRKKLAGEILSLNSKLNRITNLNSKYRLQAKLQFALAYISKYWKKDYLEGESGEAVNKIVENMVENFRPERDIISRQEFLELMKRRDGKREKLASKLINYYDFKNNQNIFDNTLENNLIKLYILLYNLLPVEFREEFLKQAKKYIYESRFINKAGNNQSKNTFFEDLKLFERNIDRIDLIDYSLLDLFKEDDQAKKLKNQLESYILGSIEGVDNNDLMGRIFRQDNSYLKELLGPIFQYYLLALKFLNDLELKYEYDLSLKDESGTGENSSQGEALDLEEVLRLKQDLLGLDQEKLFIQALDLKKPSPFVYKINCKLIKIQKNQNLSQKYAREINDLNMRHRKLIDDLSYSINRQARYKISNIKSYAQEETRLIKLLDLIKKKEAKILDLYENKNRKEIKKEEREVARLHKDLEKIVGKLVEVWSYNILRSWQLVLVEVETRDWGQEGESLVDHFYYSYCPELDLYQALAGNKNHSLDGNILTLVEKRDEKLPIQKVDLSRQYKHKRKFVLK